MPMPHGFELSLKAGVRKRELFGWAMYDFANSGYTTVILTAVYAAYFVGSVAQGATWATLAWTASLSLSYLVVMLTIPAISLQADARGNKLQWLRWSTLGCVITTAALAWPHSDHLWLAILLLVLSNVFYSYGESLIAAFLPEIARPHALGRVSGWGWGWGYLGGMLTLGLCLAYVLQAQANDQPATQFVPVTLWMTAGIFGVAALLTFAFLRERAVLNTQQAQAAMTWPQAVRVSLQGLQTSYQSTRDFVDFRRLLYCTVAYQAGVAVAITIAAIYAEQVIGFEPQETMILIFALNIAAAVGALGFGHVQDVLGHKRALAMTLVIWILTCLIAAWSSSKGEFWIAATLAGIAMGSSQSAGRAMVGQFSPEARRAEFFGLWSVAIRLASIIGPLSYGLITLVTQGQHRIAIVATALFFVAGLWILKSIQMERGAAAAH